MKHVSTFDSLAT